MNIIEALMISLFSSKVRLGLPYKSSFTKVCSLKLDKFLLIIFFFFNCYLAAPRQILGHYRGDSLTHPMLITAVFFTFLTQGHWEPRNEIGSLSPAERLVGFEPGTFRYLLQRLNPLGHSPLSH